ncbi:Probable RNA-directed DNA polymerase from transposon BS [Eumeta japonica]|uniref:Probable RNA-directed DNA polymerase from transposon BS n=1 Tax=Eumeta variegata TaxID=151549 RepID=A0A4C1WY95_EUMVA|nr:Probable RNA-directed DNA polymerase from transposon BS [Eumeta japonica]
MRAGGSGILGSLEVSAPNVLELIRVKNAALRRASAYPTPEYRSRALALQREVKARVQEFRNESWSDLMEEIGPSHKAFWKVTKALKTEGYIPIPPLKIPDNSVAINDAEIVECLADSIETQCSHVSPPHDIAHINRIEEEVLQKTSLEPKRRSDSRLTQRSPNANEITQYQKSTESQRRPIRAGVPQGSTLSALLYSTYTNDIPRPSSGVELVLFADDTALFHRSKNRSTRSILLRLQKAIDELGQWFRLWRIEVNPDKRQLYHLSTASIGTVMTYASPVFAHAAPKVLDRLQVIQNKFCRLATDAHWCVRNSILHRDL